MKLIGILWNSIGDKKEEATNYIKQFGDIEYYDVNFGNDYKQFLLDLYPFNDTEKWKAEFKVNGLVDKYDNNNIRIIIINMADTEKVYLKNKNKMMYKNVLELKVGLRNRYESLVTKNDLSFDKKYDNVFHMSDEEEEYEENLTIILQYLSKYSKSNKELMSISSFVDERLIKFEKRGTRNTYWITTDLLFKENSKDSYEMYSEIFNMYFMKMFGLTNCPTYKLFSCFDKPGVLTKRINTNKGKTVFLDEIFAEYGFFEKKDLIIHNNLEELPLMLEKYCYKNNLKLEVNLVDNLKRLFLYDILTCQNDRNPTNICLKYDEIDRTVTLHYFDNSNMLYFHQPELLSKYLLGNLDIYNYLCNNTSTFLLNKAEDIEICFDDKIEHLKSFLTIEENKNLFDEFCDLFTLENIIFTFNLIEREENFIFPSGFKKSITNYYDIFIKKLNVVMIDINYKKKLINMI